MDPAVRRATEGRLLAALRSMHRREPMRPDVRVDALLAAARAVPTNRSARHRGATPIPTDDAELLAVIDAMAADGRIARDGRRVRLAEHRPDLEPVMRERVERLLDGLRQAGVNVPRVEGPAARLGIPDGVLRQLRASGELVSLAPGIDYPGATWDEVRGRVDRLAAGGPLTVAAARNALRTSRRHAEAILARWRADHRRSGRRG
ncbi:MAG TPA: hypothetical protein VHK63_01125 [Candidatus Limnocylindria bacterium]|nr:hypothetical protein [Candidatus Limnocylindria bacterium]